MTEVMATEVMATKVMATEVKAIVRRPERERRP